MPYFVRVSYFARPAPDPPASRPPGVAWRLEHTPGPMSAQVKKGGESSGYTVLVCKKLAKSGRM